MPFSINHLQLFITPLALCWHFIGIDFRNRGLHGDEDVGGAVLEIDLLEFIGIVS